MSTPGGPLPLLESLLKSEKVERICLDAQTDRVLPSESSQFTKGGEEKPAAILQALSAVTEKRGVVGLALRGAVWLPNQMD